jgi:hypothetical protein
MMFALRETCGVVWSCVACIVGMKEVCPAPLLFVSAPTLTRQSLPT